MILNPKTLMEILEKDIKQVEKELEKYDSLISSLQGEVEELSNSIKIKESEIGNLITERIEKVEQIKEVHDNKLQVLGAYKMYKAKLESNN